MKEYTDYNFPKRAEIATAQSVLRAYPELMGCTGYELQEALAIKEELALFDQDIDQRHIAWLRAKLWPYETPNLKLVLPLRLLNLGAGLGMLWLSFGHIEDSVRQVRYIPGAVADASFARLEITRLAPTSLNLKAIDISLAGVRVDAKKMLEPVTREYIKNMNQKDVAVWSKLWDSSMSLFQGVTTGIGGVVLALRTFSRVSRKSTFVVPVIQKLTGK